LPFTAVRLAAFLCGDLTAPPSTTPLSESHPLVEPHAHGVRRVDTADDDVIVLFDGGGDDSVEQYASVTLAAEARVHIYRVLDRVLVGRALAEHAVSGEAEEQSGIVLETDDRITSLGLRFKPAHHPLGGARRVVVQRGGIRDGIVEDFQDRRRMPLRLAVDEFHAPPCLYFANSPLDIL
jgi:hypothetical protein